MTFDPATEIQNYLVFGEFGDVNPSICDSSTYTFHSVARMEELFDHEVEGCFLYSRQFNPLNTFQTDYNMIFFDKYDGNGSNDGQCGMSITERSI